MTTHPVPESREAPTPPEASAKSGDARVGISLREWYAIGFIIALLIALFLFRHGTNL